MERLLRLLRPAPRTACSVVGVCVLAALLFALSCGDSHPLRPPTEIIDYVAPPPSAAPLGDGDCQAPSLASRRDDAFRCFADSANRVLDPCFAASATAVWCEPNPTQDARGLPLTFEPPSDDIARADVEVGLEYWLIELEGGVVCGVMTGTRTAIDDLFSNYGCSDGSVGFGAVKNLPRGTLRTVSPSAAFPYTGQDLEERAVIRAWR